MDINFSEDDFKNLSDVERLNKRYYFPEKKYPGKKFRAKVRNIKAPTWYKMRDLKNKFYDELYFTSRFHFNVSNTHQQGNITEEGRIKENIWIYFVDIYEYLNRKNKSNYAQLKIPQLQISIGPNGLTTSSIWLEENNCESIFREKLSYFLEKNKTDSKYNFVVTHKNKLIYKDYRQYINKNDYSFGIQTYLTIPKAVSEDNMIYDKIIESLQNIIDDIYYPCFKFKKSSKITSSKIQRYANRKASETLEIKKILRKGTESKIINQLHKEVQNELVEFLKSNNKRTTIKLEEDFIDVKMEIPKQERVVLYEIKTNQKAIQCIKAGLGQLLFYSIYTKGFKNIEMVIVGLYKLTKSDKNFVNIIKKYLGKNKFRYQVFDKKRKILLPERHS